jgi:hypothetical protein
VIVSVASWYAAALIAASGYIHTMLRLVFTTMHHVGRIVHIALITFFMGTGATRFLLDVD